MKKLFILIIILLAAFILIYFPTKEDSYKVQLMDQSLNKPFSNTEVEITEIILCEPGGDCPEVILFTDKTNKDGILTIPRNLTYGRVKILPDEYYWATIKPLDLNEEIIVLNFWPRD